MKKLKIGTKVFDVMYGWGTVFGSDSDEVAVQFPNGSIGTYLPDGKKNSNCINPILSLTEYSLEKGGFTPIDTEPPLQVGELAFFYFHNGTHLHYSAIADINNDCNGNPIKYFTVCGYTFDYASREIPQWFLDKFQNK